MKLLQVLFIHPTLLLHCLNTKQEKKTQGITIRVGGIFTKGITRVITTHPEGNMTVCSKSLQSIQWLLRHFSEKHECHSPDDAIGTVRGSQMSEQFILWGQLMFLQNVMAIHPIVVKIFQDEPK